MQAPINLPVDQCNVEDGGKGGKINKIIKKKKHLHTTHCFGLLLEVKVSKAKFSTKT
jgi:hypothetical protein